MAQGGAVGQGDVGETVLGERHVESAVLLDLWERSTRLTPTERANLLAAAVEPRTDPESIASQPVGHRDARLLELKAGLGGPEIDATTTCPSCGTELEFGFHADDLASLPLADASPRSSTIDGVEVVWRCATGADLAAVAVLADPAEAEHALLERCVLSVERHGDSAGDHSILDGALREAVVRAMEEADPLADLRTTLTCEGCGTPFEAEVDLAEFAWAEVRAGAQRLLWDVDTLARTYGWTEPDVLALPPSRRRMYVDMAVGGPPVIDGPMDGVGVDRAGTEVVGG